MSSFLAGTLLIGIDEEVCQVFARERGRLRRDGESIPDFDLLIGATAVRHGIPLLTSNRSHFERMRELVLAEVSC